MEKEIEIERKFLLRRKPRIFNSEEYDLAEISQQYLNNDNPNITERIRSIHGKDITKYIHTKKTSIEDSIGDFEDENEITFEKFCKLETETHSYITKDRYTLVIGRITWCIDIYSNINLVMAEAEIISNEENLKEDEEYLMNIEIPDFITKELIIEVTGNRKFSNRSLAISTKISN